MAYNPFKQVLFCVGCGFVGLIAGVLVNGFIVALGPRLIPPPAGLDMTSIEGLKNALPHLQPYHFIFPFLAHALGTFFGAYLAARLSRRCSKLLALIIGTLFFVGGLINVVLLPAPVWFEIVDLTIAYFPMAILAGKLSCRHASGALKR
ncbi:MAG: hypothetical protein NZM15_06600 [Flavobacteriales bacterium]|nr:hypothetical protein [Flavobacteriales bacterium]MDW8432351.1 hypothetical protein [Flavobacteriales bacterium]